MDGNPPKARGDWVPLLPVPGDAPAPPATHPTLGAPSAAWTYRDAGGHVLGRVCRFARAGGKEILPQTFCRHSASGVVAWRWKSWAIPRPLYGLDRLGAAPGAAVIVCEGEKTADAAGRLLGGYAVVTSPHGAKSAAKADWSPLAGRSVTIWPDADAAGAAYGDEVAHILAALGVAARILAPPEGVAASWDAADAEAAGWTAERAAAFAASAAAARTGARAAMSAPVAAEAGPGDGAATRRDGVQRDLVLELLDAVELWHDPDREAFATVPVGAHRENHAVRGREFRLWLTGRYFRVHKRAPGAQAFDEALRCIEASAVNDGHMYETFRRVGERSGKLYLDIGSPDWRAVEIAATGWRVVDGGGCRFVRSPAMRALPVPEPGEGIERLRRFVNASDDDFSLLVGWLAAGLRPRGPFPILIVGGEHGSAKSTLSRIVRALVDPNASPIRATPRDDRDLLVAAINSWCLAFDNLSQLPGWLSDALCRLATGGGFGTRTLHTDAAETVFAAMRPIVLNGIADLAARPDLQDRAITLFLPGIKDGDRKPETEFWRDFAVEAPLILGALLDGASAGLRHLATTRLDNLPRMADFALWAEACGPGFGWAPGAFSTVYEGNRAGAAQVSLEASAVAQAIIRLIGSRYEPPARFEGTATVLLAEIEELTDEGTRRMRTWPKGPSELGSQVRRLAPLLRGNGLVVESQREGKGRRRIISIYRVEA